MSRRTILLICIPVLGRFPALSYPFGWLAGWLAWSLRPSLRRRLTRTMLPVCGGNRRLAGHAGIAACRRAGFRQDDRHPVAHAQHARSPDLGMEPEQGFGQMREGGLAVSTLKRDLPLQGIAVAQNLGDAVLQVDDLLLGGQLETGTDGGPLFFDGGVVDVEGQGGCQDEHRQRQPEAAKKVDDRMWCRVGWHHVSCWAWHRSSR